MFYIFLNVF